MNNPSTGKKNREKEKSLKVARNLCSAPCLEVDATHNLCHDLYKQNCGGVVVWGKVMASNKKLITRSAIFLHHRGHL